MPKTIGLDVVIGASVGTAIKSVELVTNSTKVLGNTIEKLNSKKVTILDNIDKEFKAKLEPLEKKLQKFYKKQKDIKLNIKIKDDELKEFKKKIKDTEKEIKSLEKEKLNLDKEFKKGNISANEFESKTKEIENELTKLQKKKLGLDSKIEITTKKSTHLKNSLNSVNKSIDKIKNEKLNLSNQLEKAKEKAIQTNRELKKIGSTIESLNKRKIKIQANMDKRENLKSKALDTFALGATIAAPFKAGIDFESEMARVKALSGATGEEFKKLQDTAKELGSKTVFSASEAAKGMQFLAMAGFKTNEITKAMPGLLSLASAGQTDLATTADITSNILSGFGIKADKTTHVADVMAKAMTTANVDVTMLGETMKYVAPAASGLGASLEEVTTLTAKLGDVGIQASNAGTALRSMYLRMASPPAGAQKVIAKLGLTTKDANGKFVGMINIIKQLQEKTKGLSNTQIAGIMKDLFGTEATSAATALLKVPVDKLKKYEKSLINADGTAKRIADTQTKTVAGSFKALGSAIEGVSISFSSLFLPVIQNVTKGITWLTQKLNSFIENHKTLATVLGGAVAGFVSLTVASFALGYAGTFVANAYHKTMIAFSLLKNATLLLATAEGRATLQTKLLSFWSGVLNTKAKIITFSKTAWAFATNVLSKSFGILGGVIKFVGSGVMWLGRVMLANPIGLAIAVIAGGAYLIYSNWDKLKSFFSGFFTNIKSYFSPVSNFLTNVFTSPINTIQKYWHKLIGWINNKLKWITSIGSKIKSFFGFGDDEKKKLTLKPVADKVKPIVTATALATTTTTAQPTNTQLKPIQEVSPTVKPVDIKSIEPVKPISVPVSNTQVQNTKNAQTSQTIVYNFNFGDIKVETKDGKIANPKELQEEIKKVIEDMNFENKQRSLADVM